MCLALRLYPSDRSKIAVAHPGSPDECLQDVLVKWLQKGYNYQLRGSPCWRMLVGAVGNPAGGNDCALAEGIAKKHPGMYRNEAGTERRVSCYPKYYFDWMLQFINSVNNTFSP